MIKEFFLVLTFFWSSSPSNFNRYINAQYLNFHDGHVDGYSKLLNYHVRLVRGGQ